MIKRKITEILCEAVRQVPVITILGPRQSGKTTLVKELFPDYTYVNLEDPKTRQLASDDYEGFFAKYKEPMIIDEVQRVPELLSAIQVRVDAQREVTGRFILTGSHQPSLRAGISQSLAGRTEILTLLPLSMIELMVNGTPPGTADELLLRGFMPELYRQGSRKPRTYYRDYMRTYIERDLRQLIAVKDLTSFEKFLYLLAGRVGQIVNLSAMAGAVGVSSTTLNQWLSVLEASFIIFRLQPYFSNISKRHTKSPKVYFTEPGLVSYLLGLETTEQISRDPLRGQLFENLVIVEAMKSRLNENEDPSLYFVRTDKGVEIDLVLKTAGRLRPFEIKSALTPTKEFSRHLNSFRDAEPTCISPTVIYSGEAYPSYNGVEYINFHTVADAISNTSNTQRSDTYE